jgi:dienelactone hydrolase
VAVGHPQTRALRDSIRLGRRQRIVNNASEILDDRRMRTLEICLLLLNALLLVGGIFLRRRSRWILVAGLSGLPLMMAQILLEGYRWQLLPAYVVTAIVFVTNLRLLISSSLADSPRKLGNIVFRLAGLGLIGLAGLLSWALPVFSFPTPTGAYPVGTVTLHFTDDARRETFSANTNDHRELMVQLWYPAEPSPDAKRESYLANLNGSGMAKRKAFGARFAQLDLVETHSFRSAAVSKARKSWPILIFSPSWSGSRNQNTFQAEELASHGFIVAGIDHTYCTGITAFPDGRIIFSDPSLDIDFSNDEAVQRYIAFAAAQAKLRAQDAVFVLNQLEKLNAKDPGGLFTGKLETSRVGIFGHSFGGTVAAEACWLDSRFKAGLNMDGMLFGDPVEARIRQPFMFMNEDEVAPTAAEMARSSFAKLDGRSFQVQDAYLKRNGGYNLSIRKSKHLNFSDTALFSPLHRLTGAGAINARRGLKIVDAYTLAFFEKYLGSTASPLLDGPSPDYPEVTLEKYGR